MPSLHVAWSTWCAFALYPVLRRRWTRTLIVAYPVATLVAIVVTGNHFLLDAVGGWLVLAAGVGVATAIDRRRVLTERPS
jgi:membrane-associated phospholipid phosphatase